MFLIGFSQEGKREEQQEEMRVDSGQQEIKKDADVDEESCNRMVFWRHTLRTGRGRANRSDVDST